ncbi:MAG TPA: hypothetical protein VMU66_11000, partial [Gaiellales bacterium]|nr:hypothetical protein [Gaiellales bacterium]
MSNAGPSTIPAASTRSISSRSAGSSRVSRPAAISFQRCELAGLPAVTSDTGGRARSSTYCIAS